MDVSPQIELSVSLWVQRVSYPEGVFYEVISGDRNGVIRGIGRARLFTRAAALSLQDLASTYVSLPESELNTTEFTTHNNH